MAASNIGHAYPAALSFFARHRRDSHTVQNRFGHALTQSWRTFSAAVNCGWLVGVTGEQVLQGFNFVPALKAKHRQVTSQRVSQRLPLSDSW
jgi:hypothetical protein